MNIETFREKLDEGDFTYKGFSISMLPNWNGDGKTCVAYNGCTSYRGRDKDIFDFLHYTGERKRQAKVELVYGRN